MSKNVGNDQREKFNIRVGEEWSDLDIKFEEAESRTWISSVLLMLALLLIGMAAAFFVATGDSSGVSGIAEFSRLVVILLLFQYGHASHGPP